MVGDTQDAFLVGNNEDGVVFVDAEGIETFDEVLEAPQVYAGFWFVEDEEGGFLGDEEGDFDSFGLAAGDF